MFFPRLRRQAKWMFVFLALVFGVGFVVFGVGSGLPSGVGDILRGSAGSSDDRVSVSEARELVRESPNDPTGYRQLATALQIEGRNEEAIAPLERFVRMRPNDQKALEQLGSLYLSKATRLQDEARLAQFEAQAAQSGSIFAPGLQIGAGQSLSQDLITQAISETVNARLSRSFAAMQAAFRKAEATYSKIAALAPDDPDVQLQLAQTAQAAGDTKTAVAAFRRFLKLAPDDPSAPLVKQQIEQLEASPGVPAG